MTEPLLLLENARIEAGGAPLLQNVSAQSHARRLALAGPWSALYRLLSREAVLGAGKVEVLGGAAYAAVREGVVGLAPLDPPRMATWNVLEYVRRNAELSGVELRHSSGRAHLALSRLGISHLEHRKLGSLATWEYRAVIVAAASSAHPAVLAIESPLFGLDATSAELMEAVVERAAHDCCLLVSLPAWETLSAEQRLLRRCDDVLLLRDGAVARAHPERMLSAAHTYWLVVTAHADELCTALEAAGLSVVRGTSRATDLGAGIWVHSDTRGSDAIVEAAVSCDAPIVQLVPVLSRATPPT